MLGAIAGDVIGSVHEGAGTKTKDFPLFEEYSRFTDDSVLTVAVAQQLLHGDPAIKGGYTMRLHEFFHYYPWAGYGGKFIGWALARSTDPYNSWGNGSAMRVSAVGWAFDDLDAVLAEAQRTAEVTHNHPEGIRGAQASASAIWLARQGKSRAEIKHYVASQFGYDLNRRLAEIRERYCFDVSCQGSVPESIIAFLESTDYEDAIRNAISLGGDADTMACIAGGIAEAFYGDIPDEIIAGTMGRLDERLRLIVREFRQKFVLK